MSETTIQDRLDYLRGEIEAERISWGELAELQALGSQGLIPDDEMLLRQWAGLPESSDDVAPVSLESAIAAFLASGYDLDEWEPGEDVDFDSLVEDVAREAIRKANR